MELRHLRYFVAVAEEREFHASSATAAYCAASLSRQIQQLEETLGVQLFERNSRPLKLTETGKFFYAHAAQLLAQTAELESMTRRVGHHRAQLSVGFVGSTLYGMLPKNHPALPRREHHGRTQPPRNVDDGSDQGAEGRPHRCRVRPHST